MINVIILAAEHCLMSSVAGTMDVLSQTGRLWNGIVGIDPSPYFDVKIVTLDGKPVLASNQVMITPHCSLDEVDDVDFAVGDKRGCFIVRVSWHAYLPSNSARLGIQTHQHLAVFVENEEIAIGEGWCRNIGRDHLRIDTGPRNRVIVVRVVTDEACFAIAESTSPLAVLTVLR